MNSAYDDLPLVLRASIDRKEFAWLGDRQRQELEQEMTTPDDDAEDPAK